MTSPTEQEIVARAIDETYAAACSTISYRFRDLPASPSDFEAILKAASKNVISALDSHRAKNAGEVENGLDNLANHLFSLDSGSGEGKLLVQAANLISTLRSAVAEKDEALRPFVKYYELNDCETWDDDNALEIPIRDLRRASVAVEK